MLPSPGDLYCSPSPQRSTCAVLVLVKLEPDFAHFVLSLHDAERGGEGKVGWSHYLDQGAGFIVQVTHIVDKGAHIVRQLAETSHR